MRGSFNKVVIIKNTVLKIESADSLYSRDLKTKMDSYNYKKYYNDLKNIGVDVATLYLNLNIFGKNFQLEKNIKGDSLQNYIENPKNNIKDKLLKFEQLLLIYKKTLNSDVCVDLNMKNYIISGNRLVYIDFTPSIYKSKINTIENRNEYFNSYLNSEIAMSNLINYFLRSILYLDKKELKDIIEDVKQVIYEVLNIELNLSNNLKHCILQQYIDDEITYEEYEKVYQKIKRT